MDAYRPSWLDRPSLNEVSSQQRDASKGESRLQALAEEKTLTTITDAQFKKIVRERDKQRCRRCGRKTKIQLERDPLRCEVHHLHGRIGKLRHEDRCALVLCSSDHEKVTGRVNERYVVVGTKFIDIDGRQCIDARAPVKFVRVC